MTINPFLAGVLATLFAEMVVIIVWAVLHANKDNQ